MHAWHVLEQGEAADLDEDAHCHLGPQSPTNVAEAELQKNLEVNNYYLLSIVLATYSSNKKSKNNYHIMQ